VSRQPIKSRFDSSQFRITRGALILLFLQLGLSATWLLSDDPTRETLIEWLGASTDSVWRHYKVWTLVTSPFLETDFASLLFQSLVIWLFVPTIERWWGIKRFLRFAAYTSVLAVIAGTASGFIFGDAYILGLDPFIYGCIVAFGILYATGPVQFFGVLPMTGRQLMYGILAFVTLFVVLQQAWPLGVAFAASIGLAALLTTGRWNPRLWWLKLKQRRVRSHLKVVRGDDDPKKWLN
jgi:membrane associated rhomboid family serine protease